MVDARDQIGYMEVGEGEEQRRRETEWEGRDKTETCGKRSRTLDAPSRLGHETVVVGVMLPTSE